MAYRVSISPAALRDAEAGYLWLKEQVSERQATKWYNGLVEAVYSLDTLPLRCPLAAESAELGMALRQLLYGKRSATYRILFALMREGDEEVVRRRLLAEGMEATLADKPMGPTQPKKLTGDIGAKITLLACSDPPEGFARWTLRLLAERTVELGYLDSISHAAIGETLKKTNSSPGASRPGVSASSPPRLCGSAFLDA
ncbi:MAG TPA: helix-turn-helix domain-containing protein [Chthonomonadaceae bacterium]|nr:helix-turn-helix domain-containing protein [Chthonomonadaceae bacterium]